jgi:hypothetical protein
MINDNNEDNTLMSLFRRPSILVTIEDPANFQEKETAEIIQLANDEKQFKKIFINEYSKTDLDCLNNEGKLYFIQTLTNRLKALIREYQNTSPYALKLPLVAERFLTWLIDNEQKLLTDVSVIERENFKNIRNDNGPKSHGTSDKKPDIIAVASYALMHVFWGKVDVLKKITDTNCHTIAKEYGISQITFTKAYKDQLETNDRKPKSKNKLHLKYYFLRFENAVKMLKTRSTAAFEIANKELEILKKTYEYDD